MRHSIAVKFIALCLAALSLLVCVGSAAGIIGLAAMDLYEDSVEERYNESMHSIRQNFAVNLAHRYASLNLGKLPDQYLNDYYGLNWMYNTFQYGCFYYTIYNEHGEVVETTMDDAPQGGTTYQMAVTNIRYRALVDILVETEEGLVPSEPPAASEPPATSEPATENTIPTTTSTMDGTSATIPDTALARESELINGSYFDYEQEKMVYFTFIYRDLPPYTVELYLLPGAMPEEYAWTLLRQVWTVRYELFWVLGISALLFAVFMVYLCLAAGRKKGAEEIRAGGLNCIPLDLYLVCGGLAGTFCVAVGFEVLEHLLRYSPKILVPTAVLGGFLICLLIVAFLFACAAQFKTANGYWWRNSVTGRCLQLIAWIWNKFIDACVWIFDRLPGFLKRVFRKLKSWTIALFTWGWSVAVKLWDVLIRLCRWAWNGVKTVFVWLAKQLAYAYGLLPLMWQWLIIGAVLLLGTFFAILSRSEGLLVLAICLGFVIIVYGAVSFGILMDAAKKMGKGDLDTKVSDKYLVGAFRDFGADLNALVDVAVVAAQKQLKSERMKTELITNVSHDIKTPLTSIINYVDLLQKPHSEEEQETYLEVLSRQSGQLKKLIDDLMEMSKASTGNMAVEISAVNAVEAINQALGEFADKLERVQLTPVFRQPEEPVYMKADGRLAWRVLSNLLSNAYKYALPGTRLYIDLMELEGKVVISMKNISREELNVSADELLERFVRGDASRNTEGSGLGLNIAKSLVELQHGQMHLMVDGDLFKVTLIFPCA